MRKLLCELTKGTGLSSTVRSKSNNYVERTVTKIWMPASLLDLASTSRSGQCLRSSRAPQCTRFVHDPFNYMTREVLRRLSFFTDAYYGESFRNARVCPLSLSSSFNKQCPFSCIITIDLAFCLSLTRSFHRPIDRPIERRANDQKGGKGKLIKRHTTLDTYFGRSCRSFATSRSIYSSFFFPPSFLLASLCPSPPTPVLCLGRHCSSIVRERREKDSIKS